MSRYTKIENDEDVFSGQHIESDQGLQSPPDLIQHDLADFNTPQAQTASHSGDQKHGHMFQMGFYRRFFDINTDEFFEKVRLALNPFNNASAVAGVDEDSELYGFIWITATLIFLMFVSSTSSNLVSHWLYSDKDDGKYEYDFSLLTMSIIMFYGYTALVPFLFFAATTWFMKFEERFSLTRVISIYSYANVLWFPVTVANFILVVFVSSSKHHKLLSALQWILVAASGAVSGLSIVVKLRPLILKNTRGLSGDGTAEDQKRLRLLISVLIAAHVAFTVLVKVLFF
ncbi:Yip1 domain family protein [Clavispora lusitaniae]|uniref:Yip1 domain family protein n=1 Tax=Clavispora lusitaniae TaxID=36911 RepID=UPI00202C068D|nr:Yip1 domain family protein [Clavispora lusitaniae]